MAWFNNLKKGLATIFGRGGAEVWKPYGPVHDRYPGGWQRNDECSPEDLLGYSAVYACITLTANDISKLPLKLVRKDSNGIWNETESSAYSPVLRKPNEHQNRIQFFEQWVLSILSTGNTYVLKRRDKRQVVKALYVLDPSRVTPLISDSGEVFYRLDSESLVGLNDQVIVPASEIIHDRMNPIYHPLVGVSPLYAAAGSVTQGLRIQENAVHFFANHSRPGGVLTAPGALEDETIAQLKEQWEANYSGNNSGKVAILADGLKYDSFQRQSAADSQVIEQLGWSSSVVCSVFHVPQYMVFGEAPAFNNIVQLNQQYYAQALQNRIESIELCLDEGLGMDRNIGTEFDLRNLLRMDEASLIEAQTKAVGGSVMTINEARKNLNLAPLEFGDTIFLQQQNYSLSALNRRDSSPDPFGTGNGTKTQLALWQLEAEIAELKKENRNAA